MLKLLAVELHTADTTNSIHRETCQSIVAELFGEKFVERGINYDISTYDKNVIDIATSSSTNRSKVSLLTGICVIVCFKRFQAQGTEILLWTENTSLFSIYTLKYLLWQYDLLLGNCEKPALQNFISRKLMKETYYKKL